jgi:hypothetical protein
MTTRSYVMVHITDGQRILYKGCQLVETEDGKTTMPELNLRLPEVHLVDQLRRQLAHAQEEAAMWKDRFESLERDFDATIKEIHRQRWDPW